MLFPIDLSQGKKETETEGALPRPREKAALTAGPGQVPPWERLQHLGGTYGHVPGAQAGPGIPCGNRGPKLWSPAAPGPPPQKARRR